MLKNNVVFLIFRDHEGGAEILGLQPYRPPHYDDDDDDDDDDADDDNDDEQNSEGISIALSQT